MKHRRPLIPIAILILAAAAYWGYQQYSPRPSIGVLTASGTIEAEEVLVAAEVGGRIVRLEVDEGDAVKAGQVVVQLDESLLAAQLKQAQGGLEVARANLALVQARTRDEELAQARAALAQAVANRGGAQKALDNAIALRDNPQDINTRIDAAQTEYDAINVEGARTAWQNAIALRDNPQDINTRIDAAQAEYDAINVDGARTAWQNAVALRDNPQELNQRIETTKAQLEAAEHQVRQTYAIAKEAERRKDSLMYRNRALELDLATQQWWAAEEASKAAAANRDQVKKNLAGYHDMRDRPLTLNTQVDAAKAQYDTAAARKEATGRYLASLIAMRDNPLTLNAQVDAARAQYDTAVARKEATGRYLASLIAMRDNPLTLNAQVDAARAQLEAAKAAVEAAEARLRQLERGSTREQVDVAKAQVTQAEAAAEVLRVQVGKMSLRSPINGMVNKRSVHLGEMASAGATLLSIIDQEDLRLTLYISEREIGHVQLGQPVEVSVDSFPGEVFQGTVSFTAAKAEYTPRNVQTQKERVNLVFAVKVKLPNPDRRLKPGMPADAVLRR